MQNWCDLSDLLCEPSALGGSYEKIWVIRAQHVASVPKACKGGIQSEPIQIQSGTASTMYKFPHETLGFQENQKQGKGGEYFEIVLEGFRDRISPAHQHEICKLSPGHYVVIYQDANGFVRLLGSPDKPLRFTSLAGTGKKRGDDNGVLWRFYGLSKKPSIFMDPAIPPPNELLIPYARLNLFEAGDCLFAFSASGSKLSDGTPITSATPYATAMLIYRFSYAGDLLYEVSIGPDEDATDISNWNFLGGSRDFAAFETQIVDWIEAGGTGYQFTLDLGVLSVLDYPQTLSVSLVVDDWAQLSNQASVSLPLCDMPFAFSLSTTKQIGFQIDLELSSISDLYIDWGDGEIEFFENVVEDLKLAYTHDYALPGTYEVKAYIRASVIKELDVSYMEVIAFEGSALTDIEEIDLAGNDIQNQQNYLNWTKAGKIQIEKNSNLEEIILPASSPLRYFDGFSCNLNLGLDFRSFTATLEELRIYNNPNLEYSNVADCSLLEIYRAYGCNIQNDQDLTGCLALEDLKLFTNYLLEYLDVSGLSALKYLEANNCDIQNSQNLEDCTSLQTVYLHVNTDLPGITPPVSAPLRILQAYQCNISTALDLQAFSATLEQVRLNQNTDLTYCNVAGCSLLWTYRAYDCNIQNDQDLTGCTALKHLDLYLNPLLTHVDVTGLTNLTRYDVGQCDIDNIQDLSTNGSIYNISLDFNRIPELILGSHPSLTILEIRNNLITTSLNLNNSPLLNHLSMEQNLCTDVIFDQCNLIKLVDLESNSIGTTELNRIVDDTYVFRADLVGSNKHLRLAGNSGVLNATSLDKINGTGAYLGDGLVDNNWAATT